MDHALAFFRWALESGWRIGTGLTAFGIAVITAHKTGWPEPGALSAWVGWATLALAAGVALTLVALRTWCAEKIVAAKRRKRVENAQLRELRANFSAFNDDEMHVLRELLLTGRERVQVHFLSRAYPLLEKGFLREIGGPPMQPICEIPQPMLEQKEEIIATIDRLLPGGQDFLAVKMTRG